MRLDGHPAAAGRPLPASGLAPLTDDDFERCMAPLGPFERRPVLAVAVSGGADSLALSLLAARWAEARGGRAVGLTVDHNLRAGSADEARRTGIWLRRRGIEHRILTWDGAKPTSGLQARAREARYRRLAAWCRHAGVLHLLTAHHRDDQAETVALRKARRSGSAGLAAMAPVRELRGLRLLRPLLDVPKARLAAALDAIGQGWIDDPSNHDPRFARSRLRERGLDAAGLAGEACGHAESRTRADRRLASSLVRHAAIDPAGFARLPIGVFDAVPAELAASLLERLLVTIGGGRYPPRSRHLLTLLAAMQRGAPFAARTLAHCRVLIWQDRWLLCPEAARATPLALPPGQWRLWSGRFAIRLRDRRPDRCVRALGETSLLPHNLLIRQEKNRKLPAAVRPALPSIWQEDELVAVPHLGRYAPAFDPAALDLHFRPAHPLANPPFAAHMCCLAGEQTVALLHC